MVESQVKFCAPGFAVKLQKFFLDNKISPNFSLAQRWVHNDNIWSFFMWIYPSES